jgi:two-component system, cell cycle sensor histidine kinase and response regulator CckA
LRVHQIELEMQNEELRRTQEELEVSRARYFDLYDLAPVGYFTLSEQGLILEANLTAAKLLGVARGALVKQPLSKFILREDQDIHYRRRKQLLETGEPQSWELRLLEKGRRALLGAGGGNHRAGRTDGASVWRVVVSDITESKSHRGKEGEARGSKLAAPEGRRTGAHGGGHRSQIQQPAHRGDGKPGTRHWRLAEGWRARGTPDDGALRAAGDAAEISKLMLTYVGQTSAQPKPLDLSEACSRSLPLLRAAIPAGMVLDADLPSPGPVISADANQIQQALTNLVINAWEAGIDGRALFA